MTGNDHQTEPAAPAPLRYQVDELTQRNTELEKFNQALVSERESLKNDLDGCSRMLRASTTGLISLDKSGLITSVNTRAIDLLGADESYLLKKPVSLFIAPEDQAVFFINRSRMDSNDKQTPFELKLKRSDGTFRSVRTHAQPIKTPGQHLPGMLLAMEDITPYRQAMEALQFKEYFANMLFSIIDDLSVWSTADIDDVIIDALEKAGLVSRADRVYVCLFHERKTRLSITHEWVSEGIDSPTLQHAPVDTFIKVVGKVKNRSTVSIADVDTLPPDERDIHEGFHAAGVKSFLFTPLYYGRYLLGIIGCDAVRQTVAWSRETRQLINGIGVTIVSALVRRQTEKAPASSRQTIFQFVEPAVKTDSDNLHEYEGPIEIIDETTDNAGREETDWHFEAERPDDPSLIGTILLKDGKTANLACKHCNRQKLLDISEIRSIGTQLKATCVCGIPMYIKIELRREHRKTVSLDGVFIRGPGDRLALKSDDWGRIQIRNLSRRGIGFKVFGKPDLCVDDRFQVKFTLDNTAGSVIQKEVRVRSVVEEVFGCQFEGQDPCDVTLGFYMMT